MPASRYPSFARRRFAPLPLLLLLVLVAGACARGRNIREPVDGALEFTFPDSARFILQAAERAITDEGMEIALSDRKRSLVESAWTDVGALKSSVSRESYGENERVVRFRLRATRVLGGSKLVGEVVSLPYGGGGRAMERMVPRDHAGREILVRLFKRVEDRLIAERPRREREAREAQEREPKP